MSDERPIDIWNEMTTRARIAGRCMFCEEPLYAAGKRPVICTEDDCRKTYHRLYRHMVREPREQDEPAEVARVTREERNAQKRSLHARMSAEQRAHFLARCKRNRSRAGAPETPAPD